jgi:protein-S-isoprenylcysteine O-methyltransferase Ste14
MALMDDFERQGRWLFRRHGYLPLQVLLLSFLAVLSERIRTDAWRACGPWEQLCLAVSGLGLLIRVVAIGCAPAETPDRSEARPWAASLSTRGLYSLVRHPLYPGNFSLMLGVVLFARSAWLAVWYTLSFWLYYERIMAAEEAFLHREFGAAFEHWARATPAFVPRLRRWSPPTLDSSLRKRPAARIQRLLRCVRVHVPAGRGAKRLRLRAVASRSCLGGHARRGRSRVAAAALAQAPHNLFGSNPNAQ